MATDDLIGIDAEQDVVFTLNELCHRIGDKLKQEGFGFCVNKRNLEDVVFVRIYFSKPYDGGLIIPKPVLIQAPVEHLAERLMLSLIRGVKEKEMKEMYDAAQSPT